MCIGIRLRNGKFVSNYWDLWEFHDFINYTFESMIMFRLDNYDDLYSDSSVHFDTSISDQDTDNTEGSIKKVDNPLFIRLSDTK